MPTARRSAALALSLLVARPSSAEPPAATDGSYRLARAATAAAEALLRLHDTEAARRWLAQAPEPERGWEWRFLEAQSDRSLAQAAAHSRVLDVAVSPDGRTLASTGADGAVKLWDAASLRVERELVGHRAAVWTAAFSADGRRLATVSSDGTARLWDLATGATERVLEGVSRGLASLALHPDGTRIATTGWDRDRQRGVWGVVKIWTSDGRLLHAIEHGVKPIVACAWSPDGSRLFAGTWDDDVASWDAETGQRLAVLQPPASDAYKAVQGLAVDAAGARLAVAAKDGSVRVWDVRAAQLLRTLVGQAEGRAQLVNDVAWLSGRRLAAVGNDLTLRLWDAETGRELSVLHGHTGSVTSVAAAAGADRLFTGAGDGTIRAWDLAALEPSKWVWPLAADSYGIAPSPDGSKLAATGWGGWLSVFETASGREVARWEAHRESGVRVAWSPDGRWLASTGNDGRVALWDAATGRLEVELLQAEGQIGGVAWSPDGRLVAAPAGKGTTRIWSVPTGEERATLAGSERPVWDVAWSPDGATLAASADDGVTSLWDWRASQVRARLQHGAGRGVVAFHPQGRALATGSSGRLTLWEPRGGAKLRECQGHTEEIHAVAFSPDGSRLASGGSEGSLRLWDTRTCDPVLTLPFAAGVFDVAWSRDGTRLFAAPLARALVRLEAKPSR